MKKEKEHKIHDDSIDNPIRQTASPSRTFLAAASFCTSVSTETKTVATTVASKAIVTAIATAIAIALAAIIIIIAMATLHEHKHKWPWIFHINGHGSYLRLVQDGYCIARYISSIFLGCCACSHIMGASSLFSLGSSARSFVFVPRNNHRSFESCASIQASHKNFTPTGHHIEHRRLSVKNILGNSVIIFQYRFRGSVRIHELQRIRYFSF